MTGTSSQSPEPESEPDKGTTDNGLTGSTGFDLPSGLGEISGGPGNDVLRAWKASAHLVGKGGNDALFERDGDDVMTGGGGDNFVIDFRVSSGEASHDIITDLDFSQGDRIGLITNEYGTFDDSDDPSNSLMVRRRVECDHSQCR